MGYLEQSNEMIHNATKLIDDVMNSKFTWFLQNQGQPTLVTYYHVDKITSTVNQGSETPDKLIGKNSPLKYNKIKSFPIYGLKELTPSLDTIESNLLDINMEVDVFILPNTITPTEYDYILYTTATGTILLFHVYGFELNTIKNNPYYKISVNLKDINNTSLIDEIEKYQISQTFTSNLKKIGTQEKCLIENDKYELALYIKKIKDSLVEQYIDLFYEKKYHCFLCRDTNFGFDLMGFYLYDPFLSQFIINNKILDGSNIYTLELSNSANFTKIYHRTLYHNIERRDISHLYTNYASITKLNNRITNPFYYYGTENFLEVTLLTDCQGKKKENYHYMPKILIEAIQKNTLFIPNDNYDGLLCIYYNAIIKYLNQASLYNLFSKEELYQISKGELEYKQSDLYFVPMMILILSEYISYILS